MINNRQINRKPIKIQIKYYISLTCKLKNMEREKKNETEWL